jgi:hypothetical protein
MSQIGSNPALFYLDQNHIVVEQLLALGIKTGKRNQSGKHESVQAKSKVRLQHSKSDQLPHAYSIEHLLCVSEKQL